MLRVFTRGEEGGNHLGVVPDITGLHTDTMQQIAAHLGFSETIYLDWRDAGHPAVRIFTPTTELPFAGHPLVGAAWVLTALGPGGPGRLRCAKCEVAFRRDSYGGTWIELPLDWPVQPADPGTVPMPAKDASVVDGSFLLVELASSADLSALHPYLPSDTEGFYAWTWSGADRVHARFFARGIDIVEDPATGSAAVALANLLLARGRRTGSLTISQGEEMGHPSRINLRWSEGSVNVGGEVRKDEVRWLDA